jgi:uncharacterized protein YydD (DUF2326 family)
MIHRLYSPDLKSFKEIAFGPALSVVVADKTPGASQTQTRNSAGKSSILDLVHFALGGNARDSVLGADALREFAFGMTFDLAGERTTIERSPSKPSRVHVINGQPARWPRQPDKEIDGAVLRVADWRTVLGHLYFGLPTDEDSEAPSFRSLFPYFARRARDGALSDPRTTFSKQSIGEWQVALSFLLGLDWTIAKKVNALRGKASELQSLKKKTGILKDVFGDPKDLRRRHLIASERLRTLQKALAEFKVLPEYHDLEAEANRHSREVRDLTGDDALDTQALENLNLASEREEQQSPNYSRVAEMYAELGLVLPNSVAKRYEDVQAFHESVIRNRRVHLRTEISRLEKRVADRRARMASIEARQAQIMRVLQTHGALDQYTQLQSELSRVEADALALQERLANVERMETLRAELQIERQQLFLRLKQDLQEQHEEVDQATLTFHELVNALSDKQGAFDVRAGENGPEFEVKVHGDKGTGVKHMEIFCFDMMLMKLLAERSRGPGFLIHDSHLFDGVDGRQVASALRIGEDWAKRHKFQYLVVLNSDDLGRAVEEGLDVRGSVLPTRLDDRTESGGLFGFRFD